MTEEQQYSKWVSRLKLLFPVAAIALIGAVLLFGKAEPELDDLPLSYQKIELTRKGPLMREPQLKGLTNEGDPYRLTAALARPDPNNQDIIYLQDIVGTTTGKATGALQQEVTAPDGVLQRLSDRLYMTGGVVMEDMAGYRLTGPTMDVDFRANRAETRTPVIGTMENGRIEGGGMTADATSGIIVFTAPVKTTHIPPAKETAQKPQPAPTEDPDTPKRGFLTDPGAPVIITAQKLTLDRTTHIGLFAGDVLAVQGPSQLQGEQAAITVDRETRKAQTIRAEGRVVLASENGSRATGDWAEHHLDTDVIYMGGTVTLYEPGNVLRGEALQVNTQTGRATMIGGETAAGRQRVRGIFTPGQ
ncbi:MAG: LPS export ABC transporter periplasmic protein LptC [Parvibaculales bacterium]